MFTPMIRSLAAMLSLAAAPALATTYITDPITSPASYWAGIDYWGVGISQFSPVDQTLDFTVPTDSKIEIYIHGSPKIAFTDLFLGGQSIASDFAVNTSSYFKATGYAAAGNVSLRFTGDYSCANCWGDWFGGYVQVTPGILPLPEKPVVNSPGAIPEPATWGLLLTGMALTGAIMRRRKKDPNFA
ncbi:MAG: PEP-CTERM sorting domain-containing protein [Sphingomonadales bacterium]|nr:PEP-CTERM sorting domain-containing protein [Sphingomonadales bacterium]